MNPGDPILIHFRRHIPEMSIKIGDYPAKLVKINYGGKSAQVMLKGLIWIVPTRDIKPDPAVESSLK